MNVFVAQLGARRHYAVPVALEAARSLACFATDIYARHLWQRNMILLWSGWFRSAPLKRAAGRCRETGLPANKVVTFPWFGIRYKRIAHSAASRSDPAAGWLWGGKRFCELASRLRDHHADTVYAFTSAARELFLSWKGSARLVLDHATAPRLFETQLMAREADRFADWGPRYHRITESDHAYDQRQRAEVGLADIVVCGSSFIKRQLEAQGVLSDVLKVVPLGFELPFPVPELQTGDSAADGSLHVLFAGSEGIRKGIGYLSQSIGLLHSHNISARYVGDLGFSERGLRELRKTGVIVGRVPRAEMWKHYHWADILVLPSLSETFGLVILEAMSMGVPVITTFNTAGPDIIREGVDGFLVPIRDSEAIAACLDWMARNPAKVREMGHAAARRAGEFTVERYGQRLLAAFGGTNRNTE